MDWKSMRALFLWPLLTLGLLLLVATTRDYTIHNPGNVLSAWGLYVSIFVFYLAKGAKTEAQKARSEEKLRSAADTMENANSNCRAIQMHTHDQHWDQVRFRAQEVIYICRTADAKWRSEAKLNALRGKISELKNQMFTIVDETSKQQVKPKTINQALRDSEDALSDIMGKIYEPDDGRN